MSLSCVPTQYIENTSSPISTYPVTIGAWVYPLTVASGDRAFFSIGQNTTRNSLSVSINTNAPQMAADNGTAFQTTAPSGGVVAAANTWTFIIARFISATNRRISAVVFSGAVGHGQGTTSVTISGLTRIRIGNRADNFASPAQPANALIAELWYTDNDIQADGGALTSEMVSWIAQHGPFSVGTIAANIVEYHALRSTIGTSDSHRSGEYYAGKYGRMAWASSGPPTLGPHPPLMSGARSLLGLPDRLR